MPVDSLFFCFTVYFYCLLLSFLEIPRFISFIYSAQRVVGVWHFFPFLIFPDIYALLPLLAHNCFLFFFFSLPFLEIPL